MVSYRNKILGCLYGIAIGDALGAPVEFMSWDAIQAKYGSEGIQNYDKYSGFYRGYYTDDTQMSLATVNGLIKAFENNDGDFPIPYIYEEYLNWLKTQDDPSEYRSPGNTCISALRSGTMGKISLILNDSKGCGGVMRTAPIGLFYSPEKAFKIGCEAAAITHSHPTGYLTAGYLSAYISYLLSGVPNIEALNKTNDILKKYDNNDETKEAIENARSLYNKYIKNKSFSHNDLYNILKKGWVAEEALQIGLFWSLVYPDNFREGVLNAVNHSGDSDSTGSITGAIIGTIIGLEGVPEKWVKEVENSELISDLGEKILEVK